MKKKLLEAFDNHLDKDSIFKKLKKAIEKDLKNLKDTDFINEELYTVSHNKKLKKSLIKYGKDLLKFTKNPIDYCNFDLSWEGTNSQIHDIVFHNGKLYYVYEEDKNDIESIFDEKSDDYLNTDMLSSPVDYDDYFEDEEGDTRSELTYKYFENAEKIMEKYFF